MQILEEILLIGYTDNGRVVRWGKDLSGDTLASMRRKEIFTVLGPDGTPHSRILMDIGGTIRERPLNRPQEESCPDK